jgi:hypothetical protein
MTRPPDLTPEERRKAKDFDWLMGPDLSWPSRPSLVSAWASGHGLTIDPSWTGDPLAVARDEFLYTFPDGVEPLPVEWLEAEYDRYLAPRDGEAIIDAALAGAFPEGQRDRLQELRERTAAKHREGRRPCKRCGQQARQGSRWCRPCEKMVLGEKAFQDVRDALARSFAIPDHMMGDYACDCQICMTEPTHIYDTECPCDSCMRVRSMRVDRLRHTRLRAFIA